MTFSPNFVIWKGMQPRPADFQLAGIISAHDLPEGYLKNQNQSQPQGYEPDVFSKFHVTKDDDEAYSTNNLTGEKSEIFNINIEINCLFENKNFHVFIVKEKKYSGFFIEDYEEFIKLSLSIYKAISNNHIFSYETLIKDMKIWLKMRFNNIEVINLTDYLISEIEKRIELHEVWIPIAGLHVQSSFYIGRISIMPITKDMISNFPPEMMEEIGSKLQGYAAGVIRCKGQLDRVYDIALREVEKAISFLRLFSSASERSNKVLFCTLRRKEHTQTSLCLAVRNGKVENFRMSVVSGYAEWNLDDKTIVEIHKYALNKINKILSKDKLSEFEKTLFSSMMLFSKVSLLENIEDKLVYAFAALESLLTKNSSESLQYNVSERMAMIVGETLEERREIIRNFKDVYDIRSKFVHHGQNVKNNEEIDQFLLNSLTLLFQLLNDSDSFQSKEELITCIEDQKLSPK